MRKGKKHLEIPIMRFLTPLAYCDDHSRAGELKAQWLVWLRMHCVHTSAAQVSCVTWIRVLMIDCKACARLPPYQKVPQEHNNRLPGVMRLVEEFEIQFNRNMYNVNLQKEFFLGFPIGRMSPKEMTTTWCGHRLASAAHIVFYSAPAVTEWSSHHEQTRVAS